MSDSDFLLSIIETIEKISAWINTENDGTIEFNTDEYPNNHEIYAKHRNG